MISGRKRIVELPSDGILRTALLKIASLQSNSDDEELQPAGAVIYAMNVHR
jgi:hypothetical protein